MLGKQSLSIDHLAINPYTLMTYFEELCESVLNIPFGAAEEKRESRSAVTSCISAIDINRDHCCLLRICCDDDLLDIVLAKISSYSTPSLKMKNTLNILNKLTATISEGFIGLFKNDFYLDLLSSPVWSDDGIIAEGTLEHPCGCIRIVLTKL